MSKQINITRSEFQLSWKNHYSLYKRTNSVVSPRTRRLLLFYSVECGLKSLIKTEIGKNTDEELKKYSEDNQKGVHGHDLKAMTKEVGIEHKYPLKGIHLKEGQVVTSERYNELWRYGASVMDEKEEIKTEKTLQGIAQWIEQRL